MWMRFGVIDDHRRSVLWAAVEHPVVVADSHRRSEAAAVVRRLRERDVADVAVVHVSPRRVDRAVRVGGDRRLAAITDATGQCLRAVGAAQLCEPQSGELRSCDAVRLDVDRTRGVDARRDSSARRCGRSTTRDDRARGRPPRPPDSSRSIPSPDYRRRHFPVVGPAARTCALRRRSEPREAVCLWNRSSSRRQRSMESVRAAGPVLRVVVALRRASHLRPPVSAQRMHDLRRGSRRRRCPSRRPCCSHPMPSRRMALRPQATRTHSRDPSQRLGAAGSSL